MINRKFKNGETYHVTSSCGSWAVFRPHTTQTEKELTIDGHFCIKADVISNLNKHWSHEEFLRPDSHFCVKADVISNMNKHWSQEEFLRPDGVSTFPWSKGYSISVTGRETRIATDTEKLLLDYVIKFGYALTEAEIREIKINSVLEEN